MALLGECPSCREPMAEILAACALCGASLPARTVGRHARSVKEAAARVTEADLDGLRTGSWTSSLLAGAAASAAVAACGIADWTVWLEPGESVSGSLRLLQIFLGSQGIGFAVAWGGWRGRLSARLAGILLIAAVLAGDFWSFYGSGPEILAVLAKQAGSADAYSQWPKEGGLELAIHLMIRGGVLWLPVLVLPAFLASIACAQGARRWAATYGVPDASEDVPLTAAEFARYRSGSRLGSFLWAAGAAVVCAALWLGCAIGFDRVVWLAFPFMGAAVGWAAARGGWHGRGTQALAAGMLAPLFAGLAFGWLYYLTPHLAKTLADKGKAVAEDFLRGRSLAFAVELYPRFLKNMLVDTWTWMAAGAVAAWLAAGLRARQIARREDLSAPSPAAAPPAPASALDAPAQRA